MQPNPVQSVHDGIAATTCHAMDDRRIEQSEMNGGPNDG